MVKIRFQLNLKKKYIKYYNQLITGCLILRSYMMTIYCNDKYVIVLITS